MGSVWGLNGARLDAAGNPIDTSMKPRAAIGLSFVWNAPIGPLRFNFSRPLKKEPYDKVRNFDLTISTKF